MSAEPASSVRNSIEDAMPLRSMQTLQRVKALYEAWGRGTYGPVFEALDEGVVWELFAPPELPFAGVWRGRSEVSRFFSALEGAVEDPQHPMDEFLVSGDRVVAIGRFMGRARRSGREQLLDHHDAVQRAGPGAAVLDRRAHGPQADLLGFALQRLEQLRGQRAGIMLDLVLGRLDFLKKISGSLRSAWTSSP